MALIKSEPSELIYDPVKGPEYSRAVRNKLFGAIPHRMPVVVLPPRPSKSAPTVDIIHPEVSPTLEKKIEKRVPKKRTRPAQRELSEVEIRIHDLIERSPLRQDLTISKVSQGVCDFYHISLNVVLVGRRQPTVVLAREVICFLLRIFFPALTYQTIARKMGLKDPQQVSRSFGKIRKLLGSNTRMQADLIIIVCIILEERYVAAPS